MEKIIICRYTGYHHNRYDGYESSRGILAACGGSPTADCFADEDDWEIDEEIFSGKKPIDWEIVLQNLEISENELQEIDAGDPVEVTEYWGNTEVKIYFSGNPQRIVTINFSGKDINFQY